MKRLKVNKWMTYSLMICVICLLNSGAAGYEDVNECLIDPCPKGYECLNIEGGYICRDPVTGDATVYKVSYVVYRTPCSYEAFVDSEGYVNLLGEEVYVGKDHANGIWKAIFEDANTECRFGGEYLCTPITCIDFWKYYADNQ